MYGDLVAADADKAVAEQNALAAQYEAQIAEENAIKERVAVFTDEWAKAQETYPTAEEYAEYFNNAVAALQGTDSTGKTATSKYTDVDRKVAYDYVVGIVNDPNMSLDEKIAEAEKISRTAKFGEILETMTPLERTFIEQAINELYAQAEK